MASKILSIVIVNYNTRALTLACLRSILTRSAGAYEVLVVDNHSSDGSVEAILSAFPEVVILENDRNEGYAKAVNMGLREASGDFLLVLNSDTELQSDTLEKSLQFMREHRDAGIMGCKLLNADGSLQPSCRSFPSVWNIFSESFFLYLLFKRSRLFGGYYMSYFDHESIREVDVVMGAFMLIRKTVFETIGLFDETYFMYAEETDFCYRARRGGFKTFFFPGASIVHLGGGSTHENQEFYARLHASLILFLCKHHTGARLYAAIGLKNIGVALRVIIYWLAGVVTFNPALIKKSRYSFRVLFSR